MNGLIFFLTRKFQETSVTRSLMSGNAAIGSIFSILPFEGDAAPTEAQLLAEIRDLLARR